MEDWTKIIAGQMKEMSKEALEKTGDALKSAGETIKETAK